MKDVDNSSCCGGYITHLFNIRKLCRNTQNFRKRCSNNFSVDVGVVEYCYKDENKKSKQAQLEIDFVANKESKKYYIQSTLTVDNEEKRRQEVRSLNRVGIPLKRLCCQG